MPKGMKENRSFKTYRAAAEHADGQTIINVGGLYITGNINPLTCIVCIEPDGKHSGEVTVRKLQKGNHNHCDLAKKDQPGRVQIGDRVVLRGFQPMSSMECYEGYRGVCVNNEENRNLGDVMSVRLDNGDKVIQTRRQFCVKE